MSSFEKLIGIKNGKAEFEYDTKEQINALKERINILEKKETQITWDDVLKTLPNMVNLSGYQQGTHQRFKELNAELKKALDLEATLREAVFNLNSKVIDLNDEIGRHKVENAALEELLVAEREKNLREI